MIRQKLWGTPRRRGWCIAALALMPVAAFFRFALVGYTYIAALLAGVAICIALYLLLPRSLRIALTALLCAGVIVFTAAEIPVVRASRGDSDCDADYLIVLGAGLRGSVPSLSLRNRLTAAEEYLLAHPDCTAVVTGGQGPGEDATEASVMAAWLIRAGIAPERILVEDKATSTAENLEFSLAMIGGTEGETLAVVSSEYHLYRAERMGEALGVTLHGVAAKTTKPILRLNYFIREAFGVVHMWVFGL